MQINKYIGAIVLFLGLGLSPVMAECEIGTVTELHEKIVEAKKLGAKATDLTEAEVKGVIEKLGPPPNAPENETLFIVRLDYEGSSTLVVTTNECFINKVGPIPADMLNLRLGIVSAGGV